MNFDEAIENVKKVLEDIGTSINKKNYDGIIVKKLEASNTLDEGRTTKQTHIAITGEQMNMFPYLRADGYFENDSTGMKKYFVMQIPVTLKESNIKYLSKSDQIDMIFENEEIKTYASIIRSKRTAQADQIQMSLTTLDDNNFIKFRKMLHIGSYLIILKKYEKFEYECYGILSDYDNDIIQQLNNKFYGISTNTIVYADELIYNEKNKNRYLSPEWFYEKGQEFIGLDEEAKLYLEKFYQEYAPEKIEKLEGEEILKKIFLNDYNKDNLCHELEFNKECRYIFGSIKNGTAYKYGLHYSQKNSSWAIGTSNNPQFISKEEAIEIGRQILEQLIAGAKIIQESKELKSIEDYLSLYKKLDKVTDGNVNRIWFLKYYQMISPKLLPPIYSEVKQKQVLNTLGIEPSNNSIERMGQIVFYINKCNISNVIFGRVFWTYCTDNELEDNGNVVEIENYTEDELAEILKEFYNNPKYTKNAGIQLFGIKYGPLIELKKYNKAEIIKKAGLNESYNVELYKGMALSNYVEMKNCDDVEYIVSGEKSSIHGENFNTGYISKYSRNRIIFGAPGTGKSYRLNKDREELLKDGNEKNYERVTFHPDYSYANFVGTYKPIPYQKEDGEEGITYEYVPGPFMRIYVEALKNSRTDNIKPYLLIIEEINRANVAAVFGDVFQLLDRDENNVSEYPIEASEDMKKYLAKELGGTPNNYKKIYIPDNMFIWATMNSADQGVFPMDTAFKRRWEFSYLGIDEKEEGIENRYIILGNGEFKRKVEWNKLRKAINNKLGSLKVNEDKLLGPYFLSSKAISVNEKGEIDKAVFEPIFKGKVLMYLFEDAAKQRRKSLFALDDDNIRYSSICKEFDEKGVYVFDSDISKEFDKDIIEEEN